MKHSVVGRCNGCDQFTSFKQLTASTRDVTARVTDCRRGGRQPSYVEHYEPLVWLTACREVLDEEILLSSAIRYSGATCGWRCRRRIRPIIDDMRPMLSCVKYWSIADCDCGVSAPVPRRGYVRDLWCSSCTFKL